jgi:small neutral amino acid transporter SnatA (MarC family)
MVTSAKSPTIAVFSPFSAISNFTKGDYIIVALSNMRKEPKREIIETVLGFVVFVAYCYLANKFAWWFYRTVDPNDADSVFLGYVIAIFAVPIGWTLMLFIHFIGEKASNILGNMGLDPRPNPRERGY